MLRLSSYTIVSEPLPGAEAVLLNGCSGAVDIIPPVLANLITTAIEGSPHGQAFLDEAMLHPDTCASFLERGHLTRHSHEAEKGLVAEIARGLHEVELSRPRFMIAPNMDCNYRCTYCFERHVQNTLKSETAAISYHNNNVFMPRAAVPRIYDCIEAIQRNAGQDRGGLIILYGGEPLDAENRELVFDIVETGKSKGYFFAAITNGHDLDRFLPIVGRGMLTQIQISVDGPKAVHDKRRIHRGRESSFDKIMANIDKALACDGAEVQLRVHVDPSNIHHFEEVLGLFKEKGWTNRAGVVIYANTVYEKDDAGRVAADIEVGEIARRLDAIAGPYENVFTSAPAVHASRAIEPAFAGERFALKGTYCSANTGNYIFAPDGAIYACWESIGKPCSKVGTYSSNSGLVLDEAAAKRWFGRNVAEIGDCLECEYALVCGGGCAQYAEYNASSLYKPYCDDFQRTFRLALMDEVARRASLVPPG